MYIYTLDALDASPAAEQTRPAHFISTATNHTHAPSEFGHLRSFLGETPTPEGIVDRQLLESFRKQAVRVRPRQHQQRHAAYIPQALCAVFCVSPQLLTSPALWHMLAPCPALSPSSSSQGTQSQSLLVPGADRHRRRAATYLRPAFRRTLVTGFTLSLSQRHTLGFRV